MSKLHRTSLALLTAMLGLSGCGEEATLPVAAGTGPNPKLPPPKETLLPTVNIAPAKGWSGRQTPTPAEGLRVASYADGLDHPRWVYVLPNGDVLVAETNAPPRPEDNEGITGWVMSLIMARAGAVGESADRITLLRDADGDGDVDSRSVFLDGLHSPFGMALVGDDFYVANTDAVVRFPYREGDTGIDAPGETAVNERDGLGSDLVPDYMTAVEDGGFYGWPYSYFGDHVDPRVQPQRPDLVAQAIVPDYALGPHTASLGLAFADGAEALPAAFSSGAFVGQHGSWNRDPRSGYKVIFVPFENGQPAGDPVDVLSGVLSDDGEAPR